MLAGGREWHLRARPSEFVNEQCRLAWQGDTERRLAAEMRPASFQDPRRRGRLAAHRSRATWRPLRRAAGAWPLAADLRPQLPPGTSEPGALGRPTLGL